MAESDASLPAPGDPDPGAGPVAAGGSVGGGAGGPVQPRPEVRPLDVDGVGAVATGTVLWVVALLALLPFREQLAARDAEWWLWVCVAGAVLGAMGLPYVVVRRNAYRRAREDGTLPPAG